MNINEAITHYFERSNQISALWNIYVTVTLGIIAFLAAAEVTTQVRLLGLLAFVAFSTVNLLALHTAARQRELFKRIIEAAGIQENQQGVLSVSTLVNELHQVRALATVSIHLVGDIATIFFLWNGIKA
jgi:hypothetical protein